MEAAKRPSYEVTLKVPFYDLDPMQIVWHGHYLKYFDIARSELLRPPGRGPVCLLTIGRGMHLPDHPERPSNTSIALQPGGRSSSAGPR